ncbi:hypothetical protein [Enterococcus avium]|uniref:hypothetical protein n=1 Tax=Enterococcus avium TaxID=33945 RepID=UPI003DA4133E
MEKFKKMVAIEPTKLLPEWDEKLKDLAEETFFYEDIPTDAATIIDRIGDADCVMLSFTSFIDKEVLDACPNIRYIGICASLYVCARKCERRYSPCREKRDRGNRCS